MPISKARLLAAGASVLALNAMSVPQAWAGATEGIRQDDYNPIAINLYSVEIDQSYFFGAFESVSDPGAPVTVTAVVDCAYSATCAYPGAIGQFAFGSQSGSNEISIFGNQVVGAIGQAIGATATVTGGIERGITQIAAGGESASNKLDVAGHLGFEALAYANATAATADALAGINAAISQIATANGMTGVAAVSIENSGLLTIDVAATAEAAGDALASAFATAISQDSRGVASAAAELTNSGTLDAAVTAVAVGGGGASANGYVLGLQQIATARTEQNANSTSSAGGLIGTHSLNPSGSATVALENSGSISIMGEARAAGDLGARAFVEEYGLLQRAFGSSAGASLENGGSIEVGAIADVRGGGLVAAGVNIAGIDQVATALAFQTNETIDPSGVLTYELSSTPVGPAVASLANDGAILVSGAVNVVGEGVGSSDFAQGFVGAEAIDQIVIGLGAEADLSNSGSIHVVADVNVDSRNGSSGVVLASGVDQYATAYAVETTAVFATNTETPSAFDGRSNPVGSASAMLDNSGTLSVAANVTSHGEAVSFAGATASAVGQLAAGTEAGVTLDNSGEIVVGSLIESSANLAFGGAAAVGVNQAALGTATATASFENSGSVAIAAAVSAMGVAGGFANATVFGGVQDASANGPATVGFDNSGTISIEAAAVGIADDTAQAFVAGHGVVQRANAGSATLDFVNSGQFQLVLDASASADVHATASATIFDGIRQIGLGTASGTAMVSLDNSGSIQLGAFADVAAGDTGIARAGIVTAIDQSVVAGAGGDITLTNVGSIDLVASAKALAGGGEASDIAFAQAYVFGNDALVSATGLSGSAAVDLANEGSIQLAAMAHATGSGIASAYATAASGLAGNAIVVNDGSAEAVLTNVGSLELAAIAEATGGHTANAFAVGAGGAQIAATALGVADAAASLENSGSIGQYAFAHASASTNARATALAINALYDAAHAGQGSASVILDNSGVIEIVANAEAIGLNAQAYAIGGGTWFAAGVLQSAAAFGDVSAQLMNGGDIAIAALAEADGGVVATAGAFGGPGVQQFASAVSGQAHASLDNSGTITLMSAADAAATHTAFATATFFNGVISGANAATAGGDGSVGMSNDGIIEIAALANADGVDNAGALASITQGVGSFAFSVSGDAAANLANDGELSVAVNAGAQASEAMAQATIVGGLLQFATSINGDANAQLDNSGVMMIGAVANAAGSSRPADAVAILDQTIVQGAHASAGSAFASFVNKGSIEIGAGATAEGSEASALALVNGISQSASGATAEIAFSNSGDVAVMALADANANGSAGAASATATVSGYQASGQSFELDWRNSGEFSVAAMAKGDAAAGSIRGRAVGVAAMAVGDTETLSGVIDNSGELNVVALAQGAGGLTALSASAIGIDLQSGLSRLTVNNSGIIDVAAQASGGAAAATGIRVVGTGSPDGVAAVTITNNGAVIRVRQSSDGGATWRRGTAIDAASSASPVTINFLGNGSIYGDIAVNSLAVINVGGGETSFEGVINRSCIPVADGSSDCGAGVLDIKGTGTFFLRSPASSADGPSYAFLDQLNIADGGSIAFELPASGPAGRPYSQIFADTVNLDGNLLVRSSSGGLFDDSYTFDNIIDANVRNGRFDSCGIEGDPALLQLTCSYDSGNNVDLAIERIAFNAVEGLSRNEAAVGSGIEAVYDMSLNGPFRGLVEQLFGFSADSYKRALNQLTGAGYASYLQSLISLGVHQNELLDRAISCDSPSNRASSLACRGDGLNLWGQIDFANRSSEGDREAAGYDADRWTAIIGADFKVRPNALLGVSLAKLGNRLDFRDNSGIDADGFQLGAYGAFDTGRFYAKLIGTISWFDGDADRRIDWTKFAGTLSGQLAGDPDSRIWTVGAHFGYRLELNESSLLTSFLDVDHLNGKLNGFVEQGGAAGAALAVDDSASSRTIATAGLKLSADIKGATPHVEIGYRHSFGATRSSIDAAFASVAGSDFRIVSAAEDRGSIQAGLGLGGKVGSADLRVQYQGLFSGDAKTHIGNVKLVLPLGGRR